MSRRLNIKFLILLIIGTVASLGGIYLLHEYMEERNADSLLVRALEAKEAGNLEDAVRFQKRYIRHRPEDHEQLANLALYMNEWIIDGKGVERRDRGQTYYTIEHALLKLRDAEDREKYADKEEALRRAITDFRMARISGSLASPIQHLEELLKRPDLEDRVALEIRLATYYLHHEDKNKSRDKLAEMIGFDPVTETFEPRDDRDPKKMDVYTNLAIVYGMHFMNEETSEKILDKLIEHYPNSHQAYLKRCLYWRRIHTPEADAKSKEDIQQALALAPNDSDVLYTAGTIYIESNELDKAKELLDRGRQVAPDATRFHQLLASWSMRKNDYEQAVRFIDEGLAKDRDDIGLLLNRCNLEVSNGDLDRAESTLGRLRRLSDDLTINTRWQWPDLPHRLDLYDVKIKMAKLQWLPASEQLEQLRPLVLSESADLVSDVDSLLAICYANLKQVDKQIAALERLVRRNADSLPMRWRLMSAYLSGGHVDEADKTYSEIVRLTNNKGETMQPDTLKARLLLEVSKQEKRPENLRTWDSVNRLMREIQAEPSLSQSDKMKLAVSVLKLQGKDDVAAKLQRQARDTYADDLQFRFSEVEEQLRQNGAQAAIRKLSELRAEFGDSPQLRVIHGRMIVLDGGSDLSARLLELEQDVDQFSPQQKAYLYSGLAPLHNQLQDRDQALRLYQLAVDNQTDNFDLYYQLENQAIKMELDSQVRDVVSRVEDRFGRESAEFKACEASRMIWMHTRDGDNERLERARTLIMEARQKRPKWELLARIEAHRLLVQDDHEGVVEALSQIDGAAANNPIVKRQMLLSSYRLGRTEDAKAALAEIPEWFRDSEVLRVASDLSGAPGDSGQVVTIDPNSTNPNDHLRAAEHAFRMERWDDAEQALKRALVHGSGRIEPWVAMTNFLAMRGRIAEAESVIQQARIELPQYLVPLYVGKCYSQIETDEAKEKAKEFFELGYHANPFDLDILRALAEFHNQNGDYVQSRRYLNEIIALENPSNAIVQSIVHWARRELARVMLAERAAKYGRFVDYQTFIKALETVVKNKDARGLLAAEDLAALATFAKSRVDADSANQVIDYFEEAEQQRGLAKSETSQLAELYLRSSRDTGRIRQFVSSAVADAPDNIPLKLQWVGWLLEHGDTNEAENVLGQINTSDPKYAFQLMLVQSDLLARTGRMNELRQLIQRYVPTKLNDLSRNQRVVLFRMAEQTERLAKFQPALSAVAEKLYRAYRTAEPAGALYLASFLSRRGDASDVKEALRIIGSSANQQAPVAVANAALAVVNENPELCRPGSESFETAVRIIEGAGQDSALPSFLMIRATLAEIRGQTGVAEDLYRQILQTPGLDEINQARAANNLAYLLALRGEQDESWRLISDAYEILGPSANILDTRAVVHLARKDFASAKSDLETAIAQADDSAEFYFHLAQVHAFSGNRSAARNAMSQAIDMGISPDKMKPIERKQFEDLKRQLGDDA